MKVTVSLDFDALKDDIRCELENKLADYYDDDALVDRLLESFDKNIGGGFLDAVFEIEMNSDETEIDGCFLVGGQ